LTDQSAHTSKPMYAPPARRPYEDYAYYRRFADTGTGALILVARGLMLS